MIARSGVSCLLALTVALVPVVGAAQAGAQQPAAQRPAPATPATVPPTVPGAIKPPADYLIGPDDVLIITFWKDKDLSGEVTVRPDGKITLPLISDVMAAGLTPEQLREKVTTEATRFVEDPSATVSVKQINSRRVFITGEVSKPGPYPLTSPLTILQLIAIAGGLNDFAKKKEIVIIRTEGGKQITVPFDYSAVSRKTKPQQNIPLRPDDTVVVP
jgi:polysaccharide export outer membrane protein